MYQFYKSFTIELLSSPQPAISRLLASVTVSIQRVNVDVFLILVKTDNESGRKSCAVSGLDLIMIAILSSDKIGSCLVSLAVYKSHFVSFF